MAVSKLVLAILAGGPLLGILAGVAVDPTIKEPEKPWWRGKIEKRYVPVEPARIVAAGPQDLTPLGGYDGRDPGYGRHHADAPAPDNARLGLAGYRVEPAAPLPEGQAYPAGEIMNYAEELAPAPPYGDEATAARDAAADVEAALAPDQPAPEEQATPVIILPPAN